MKYLKITRVAKVATDRIPNITELKKLSSSIISLTGALSSNISKTSDASKYKGRVWGGIVGVELAKTAKKHNIIYKTKQIL